MNEKDKNIFIECECGTHLVKLQYNADCNDVDMVFFSYGINERSFGFRCKLRYIWQIIRTGTPYSDAVCLDKNESKKIVDFLSEVFEGKK